MGGAIVSISVPRARTAAAGLKARMFGPTDQAAMIRTMAANGEFLSEASHALAMFAEVVEEVSLLSDIYTARADLAVAADNFPSLAAYQAYLDQHGSALDLLLGQLGTSLHDDVTYDPVAVANERALVDLEDRIDAARADLEARRPGLEARLAELDALEDGGGLFESLGDINPWAESKQEHRDAERRRIETMLDLLGPSAATGLPRQFLLVDDSPGDNRIVEVVGDLRSAENVVIHIPGMSTTLQNYRNGGNSSVTNLYDQIGQVGAADTVVISFMDYDVPQSLPAAASGDGARSGVEPLQTLISDVHGIGVDTGHTTIVAHSYGSVVAGHTMHAGADVSRVVTVGSPGMRQGADDRSDLGSPDVELWSGRAGSDLVRFAPGHGEDPGDNGFGANRFAVGGASGHSEYFKPKTTSLRNLALIATGGDPV